MPIAEQLGFEINKTLPPWRERAWDNAFPPAERAEFIRSLDEFFQRIHDAAKSGPHRSTRSRAFSATISAAS